VQRKVFRIEQMLPASRRLPPADPRAAEESMLQRDLGVMQDMLARHKRELTGLVGEGKERRLARASEELAAAVESMDKATQTILGHVERIDDNAKSLAATLKGDYVRSLTHEIQEAVVNIYESCNFQDLAGQRIEKVMTMLGTIEDQVNAMLARAGRAEVVPYPAAKPDTDLLNGPKLDGDAGHASQRDIDKMFA
jgi:chemotaxis protein CheZ